VRLNFFLSEAVESLRRNWVMTIASVLTVLVTMAILGVVLVTDKNLKEGTTSLTNRVEVEVFVKGAPPQQASIDALRTKIAAMPEVKNFTYVSQAQALQNLKNMLGKNADQIINNLQSNPLPASYKIFVKNPNDVDAVAARFFNDPNVDNDPGTTDGVSYAKQTVRNLLGTVNLIEKAMWVVTVLFALAAILLTSTTVRLSIFARRREVEIMQLVGATNWFIRWPFILEGFITGLLGSFVAALAVWGANVVVYNWIHSSKLDFLRPIKYPLVAQSGSWPCAATCESEPTAPARSRRRGSIPPARDRRSRLIPRRPRGYHGRSCVRSSPSLPSSSSCSRSSPRSWRATRCAATPEAAPQAAPRSARAASTRSSSKSSRLTTTSRSTRRASSAPA
jgi:cell division transport system permease protein